MKSNSVNQFFPNCVVGGHTNCYKVAINFKIQDGAVRDNYMA